MRDVGPRDPEDARIPFQRAIGKLGQLPIETSRQVIANFANLLFDDMKVIDQPLGGRRDRAFLADCACDAAIRREQYSSVVAHARRHRPSAAGVGRDALRNRQRLAMLFQALDAEQFRTDRLVDMRERGCRSFRRAKKYEVQTCLSIRMTGPRAD